MCFTALRLVVDVGRYFETRLWKKMAAFKHSRPKLQSEKGDQTFGLVGILGSMPS